ncbi:family 1 encapsulin nanocompartment shell protein [Arthrobacter sp. UM1]|uniref:family 1 encapsulin nanocompartment shell protein n=1 Tax=Arthrobacter sp. UM1 TaxID=2766776 RepID=UPI001CF69A54|nr:family 1 encapsulin nanocompartment shell protein [Arthrobacter sp. UM1]MCB4208525.1 bacteriocin family protein [Arthrobacter sp. UM1]
MDNLHRELAPISAAAWADLEAEARRSFRRNVAGRRIADVTGPLGPDAAAVSTGRRTRIDSGQDGVHAALRSAQQLVELRVPFTVSRDEVDAVERGAQDPDWSPVVDAAQQAAFAEDAAVFEGLESAGIRGLSDDDAGALLELPEDVRDFPDAVAQGVSALRLESVDGPYSLVLGAEPYTRLAEVTDHGYPVLEHLRRVIDGEILWAPAVDGAYVVSGRGGDFQLVLGQDLAIGYDSHDAESVRLYFTETFTFLNLSPEAAVRLDPSSDDEEDDGAPGNS